MDKLKLEVLLSAIDKITRPLKAIQSGSSATAKALKAAKDQLKELNRAQENISGFQKVSRDASITANTLKSAQTEVKRIKQEIDKVPAPTRDMARAFQQAKDQASKLKEEHSTLIIKQQRLRDVLKESGIETSKLGDKQRDLKSQMALATGEVGKQSAALEVLNRRQQTLHAARANYDKTIGMRNKMAGAGAATTAAGVAMGIPIVKAVKDYAAFEDAMLGVARQVDGAKDANGRYTKTYYEMGDAIKALSEKLPLTSVEFANIVEAAARMGIQGKENLLTFAETAAKSAIAFDSPVAELSDQMGKLAGIYKIPIKDIASLGDAINYLDDSAQSKGADIINVMQRIAGNTASVGMSYKDSAALASTFLSLGSAAEVSASATNGIITNLSIATMQSKKFQHGLEMIKMDPKAVQLGMSKDATGTILKVMDALKSLRQEKQLEVSVDLFGKEYSDDASKLFNNLDEYRRQLALVNSEKAKGSMDREAISRTMALSAQYVLAKNSVSNLSSELGETLKPGLVDILKSIKDVLIEVRNWTKAHPELTANLVKGAAIIATVVTVLGALTLAAAAVLGPLALLRFSMAMLGIKTGGTVASVRTIGSAFRWAGNGALFMAESVGSKLARVMQASANVVRNPVVTAKNAYQSTKQGVSSTGSAVKGRSLAMIQTLRSSLPQVASEAMSLGKSLLGGLMNPLNSIGNAFSVAKNAALFFGRALLMNPVGIGIAAIALGAILIYKYWGPIKEFFAGLWSGISTAAGPALQPLWNAFKGFASILNPAFSFVIDGVSSIFGWISKLIAPIDGTSHAARSMGETVGLAIGNIISFCLSIPTKFFELGANIMHGIGDGILSGLGYVKDTLTNAGSSMIGWFKEKLGIHSPSRVFAELGGFTMQGLTNGLNDGHIDAINSIKETARKLTAIGAGIVIGGTAFAGQPASLPVMPELTQPAQEMHMPQRNSGMLSDLMSQSRQLLDRITGGAQGGTVINQPFNWDTRPSAAPMIQAEQPLVPRKDDALSHLIDQAKQLISRITGGAAGGTSSDQPVKWDNRPPIVPAKMAQASSEPIQVVQHIYPSQGMDEQQLAQLVAREFEKINRQQAANARSRLTDRE